MTRDLPAKHLRLAVCFDGTWNTLESHTNVSRLFQSISDPESGLQDQRKFYDAGVGTTRSEKILGGAIGYGLSRNILEGYCWLVNNYSLDDAQAGDWDLVEKKDAKGFHAGDHIYLFGFSRGAYTARSLAGLVNRVGIVDLRKVDPELLASDEEGRKAARERRFVTVASPIVQEAWRLYREPLADADRDWSERTRAFAMKMLAKRTPGAAKHSLKDFRRMFSIPVQIEMVGVWDTVGALGIPSSASLPGTKWWYRFHDTGLGWAIRNAFHAIAVDEHRQDYNVTLWDTWDTSRQLVKQAWFPGAHANVGGGYDDDLLPAPPLQWMAEQAAGCGLRFAHPTAVAGQYEHKPESPRAFALDGSEYLSPVRDSYSEFMGGLYRLWKSIPIVNHGRCFRRMMVQSDGVGQAVDGTIKRKWDADVEYRPRNYAHAGREDFGFPPENRAFVGPLPEAEPADPGAPA